MSAFTVLFVMTMIALAAILGDHYSRLSKMGWAPPVEDYRRGRSLIDPIGGLLGELGRADGVYKLIAAPLDLLTRSDLPYSLIAAPLGAITGFGLKR
jgi:hypothetical protein